MSAKPAPKTRPAHAASLAAETAPAPKPSLPELTRRWATAKAQAELSASEAKKLREEIETFPEAVIGYRDDSLAISETSELDLEDERLEKALKKAGRLEDALETKLSTSKIHALAKLDPKISAVVEACTKPKARWEQASKKKPT